MRLIAPNFRIYEPSQIPYSKSEYKKIQRNVVRNLKHDALDLESGIWN
jgi:hypothetical protein